MKRTFIIASMMFFMSGCTQRTAYHSYVKNYEINEIKTTYIGEPLIKIVDYYCYANDITTVVVATDNIKFNPSYDRFGIMTETATIEVNKDHIYPVTYKIIDSGKHYNVIYVSGVKGESLFGLLVDSNGNVETNKYYVSGSVTKSKTINKEDLLIKKFKVRENGCEFPIKGSINYELIYGGINNVAMSFSYREFTTDDYAKPAFYQNLTYQTDAKQIRYKNIKINVIEADNEKIKYLVVEDNIKNAKQE